MKTSFNLFKVFNTLFAIIVMALMLIELVTVGSPIGLAWVIICGVVIFFYCRWINKFKDWKAYDRFFGYAGHHFGVAFLYGSVISLSYYLIDMSWKTSELFERAFRWEMLLGLVPLAWWVFYGFYLRKKIK